MGEDETVVEAVVAFLPELDVLRMDQEAGPVGRARDLIRELFFVFCGESQEFLAAGKRAALLRGPGADLAHAVAATEVNVHVFCGKFGDVAFDANLPLAGLPVETKSDMSVGLEFVAFTGFSVAVKGKTFRAEALE